MRRAKGLSRRTITCPDCGLVLSAVDDRSCFKCVYDRRVWRQICTRAHLGDAAWCLVQRDGTHPLPPATDGGECGRNILGSHCVGLELIMERLQTDGLKVNAVNVGSTEGLAAAKRGECDVAPIHLM